jgi:hypothetical protein
MPWRSFWNERFCGEKHLRKARHPRATFADGIKTLFVLVKDYFNGAYKETWRQPLRRDSVQNCSQIQNHLFWMQQLNH